MKNIAIFASGSGTNAENIAKTFASGNRIRVAVVVTDHKDAGVKARMEPLGIPVLYFPGKVWRENPMEIVEALRPYSIDLVVLAGFMRKVDDTIIEAYPDRIINIHPSLLPAYGGKGMYGHHVHEAVIAAGETQSGVTVHKVTSELDSGDIVMQGVLEIEPGETAESLEAKIHEIEYEIFPRAIVKTLKDLDENSAANSASVPPAVRREPTPDEKWAETLSMSYVAHAVSPQEEAVCATVVESSEQQSAASHDYAVPPIPEQTVPIPQPAVAATKETPCCDKPAKSYLVLSIIFMLLFGLIPSIIALIYSIKTRRLNSIGDYVGAHKASNVCQGWLIATFCLGIVSMTMLLPIMMVSMAAGA